MIGPAMEQPQYNMLHRTKIESDYVPIYQKYGLGTTIWSPLSGGVLTGKYSRDHIPPDSRLAMEKYKVLLNDDQMSRCFLAPTGHGKT